MATLDGPAPLVAPALAALAGALAVFPTPAGDGRRTGPGDGGWSECGLAFAGLGTAVLLTTALAGPGAIPPPAEPEGGRVLVAVTAVVLLGLSWWWRALPPAVVTVPVAGLLALGAHPQVSVWAGAVLTVGAVALTVLRRKAVERPWTMNR